MKTRQRPTKRKWLLLLTPLAVATCVIIVWVVRFDTTTAPVASPAHPQATPVKTALITKEPPAEVAPIATQKPAAPAFNVSAYSTTDPASIWVVINKQHPLSPIDYAPNDLVTTHSATIRSVVRADLDAMIADASAQGVNITIVSSYRSYAYQVNLYNGYVRDNGQVATDTFSARPGFSEHQTGLAIDFGSSTNPRCNLDACYGSTVEGKWLAAHASDYGFLLRYTTEKQSVTGYMAEPWHYRYIGHLLAAEMQKRSIITLEEFFNISGGATYTQ